MTIRVRLFAQMAQQAHTHELVITFPDHSHLSDVKPHLQKGFPAVVWPPGTMLAVNQEYAGPHHPLQENDEVAIIPPVSGG